MGDGLVKEEETISKWVLRFSLFLFLKIILKNIENFKIMLFEKCISLIKKYILYAF